jgi:hypothetical protein
MELMFDSILVFVQEIFVVLLLENDTYSGITHKKIDSAGTGAMVGHSADPVIKVAQNMVFRLMVIKENNYCCISSPI